jgi:hypothetical protein
MVNLNQRTINDMKAFKTMPKPPRVKQHIKHRVPTKFEIWAWSPVLSFQVGLTASYIALIYFGVSAFLAEVPAFRETAPDGWSIYWATALVIGSIFAAFGSISRMKWFQRAELLGATLISLTVGSYAAVTLFIAYVLGDEDRASGGAGFVALAVPTLVRMMWLASQSLRK